MIYGVCFGNLMNYGIAYQAQIVADIKRLGCSFLRTDMQWSTVQPTDSSHWTWTSPDALTALAQAQGLGILWTLDSPPSWAAATNLSPPTSNAQYAAFAGACAARYTAAGSGVIGWEVWNEPNRSPNWGGAANVAQYAAMLQSAYTAIHAGDSGATVVGGACSTSATYTGYYDPRDFLSGIITAIGTTYMDAFSLHAYVWPLLASTTNAASSFSKLNVLTPNVLSILATNSIPTLPVWITECGAPTYGTNSVAMSETVTGPQGYPAQPIAVQTCHENWQASLVTNAVATAKAIANVKAFVWYNAQDWGSTPTDKEYWFGLRRQDGSPKPAWQAYATAVAL